MQQKNHKKTTSSLANLIHWSGISAINYFKLCSFCSEAFLLPFCVLDGLRYFIVALSGPSI